MKKKWFKIMGITAIILLLFLGVLKIFNPQSIAKANDEGIKKINPVTTGLNTDYNTMAEALNTSQGQLEGINISIWGESKGNSYTIMEMEDVALECANLLRLEKNAEVNIIEEEQFNKVIVTNQEKDIGVIIVMDKFKGEGLLEENYLLVELHLTKYYKDIISLENAIIEFFQNHNFNYDYAITINGSFPNKKNTDIMKEIISNTINSLGGKTSEIIGYDDIVSYTGYSPKICNNIELAGEKINLNVSMRYSELNDQTHIWIGTPLIFTEY